MGYWYFGLKFLLPFLLLTVYLERSSTYLYTDDTFTSLYLVMPYGSLMNVMTAEGLKNGKDDYWKTGRYL